MAEINVAQCTASFRLKPHSLLPRRLFYIIGTARHPTIGELATLRGFVIRRRTTWRLSGDFAAVMNSESDETMIQLSTEILDNDTNVHPWLIDGGHRSGTGCWGQELNQGHLVCLQDLTVKAPFLGRGVGSWFLKQFLHSRHDTSHVLCWPPFGQRETSIPHEHIVAFYQKNSFRRLGRTSFFCYSRNPQHPSRKLAIADDAVPLSKGFKRPSGPEDLRAEYPLHFAIISNKKSDIITAIIKAYSLDHASIHKKGPDGLTPLHLAAGGRNTYALRALLDFGANDDLRDAANIHGTTPLEVLAEGMRSDRYLVETIFSGVWDGYSPEALTCEYLLKKALNMPLLASSEFAYVVKSKHGCTCGQCAEGWLSPRMRFRLSVTAQVHHEMDITQQFYMHGSSPHSNADYLDTRYLPPSLHPHLNTAFCRSWFATFRIIHTVLAANQIPTPARVMYHPVLFDFLTRGGKAQYALDALTSIAKAQSSLGDGFFEDTYEEFGALPVCSNDLAFALVRRKLGLDPRLQWGPYSADDDCDEAMDEGSDYDSDI